MRSFSRCSQNPLARKVRVALKGEQVDLSNIPTFNELYPDHLKDIPLQEYRFDHGYPLFIHRDSAPVQVQSVHDLPKNPDSQARLTSDLPVVSELPGLRVSRGLDFLKVSFWVKWDGRESDLLPILEFMKKQVQDTENDSIPVFKEHGFDWNLYRTGTKFYTYRLKSGDVSLLFNRRKEDGKIPNCRLEIGSLSCWSPGFYGIYNLVKAFLALHCVFQSIRAVNPVEVGH